MLILQLMNKILKTKRFAKNTILIISKTLLSFYLLLYIVCLHLLIKYQIVIIAKE